MYCLSRLWLLALVLVCLSAAHWPVLAACINVKERLEAANRGQPAAIDGCLGSGKPTGPCAATANPGTERSIALHSEHATVVFKTQASAQTDPRGFHRQVQVEQLQHADPTAKQTQQGDKRQIMRLCARADESKTTSGTTRSLLEGLLMHKRDSSSARRHKHRRQLLLHDAVDNAFSGAPAPHTAAGTKPGSAGIDYLTGMVISRANKDDSDSSKETRYSSADIADAGDVPDSCLTGRHKYVQLQVVLNWTETDPSDYPALQHKVSYAIAQQLHLTNEAGEPDTTRSESFVVNVEHEAGVPGNMDLDVFVYLAGTNCEIAREILMQHIQQDPASLFLADPELHAAVVNVTTTVSDPARTVKQLIMASSNVVISVNVGSQVDSNITDGGSPSAYNWFFSSGSQKSGNLDGLLIMSITTGTLLIVSVGILLVQRWVRGWLRYREERRVTNAALAAATAARQQGN